MTKEKTKTKNEVKQELCAVPRELAIERIEKLMKKYPEVFEEYKMWISILESRINLIEDAPLTTENNTEK